MWLTITGLPIIFGTTKLLIEWQASKPNYASVVAQKTPESNTYALLDKILGTEYTGPTSLYEKAPTSNPLTQTPMHETQISDGTIPIYDTNSPFVTEEDQSAAPAQPMQYITLNNKKKGYQASPTQSPTPQRLPSTNPLNMLIQPQTTDNNTLPQ